MEEKRRLFVRDLQYKSEAFKVLIELVNGTFLMEGKVNGVFFVVLPSVAMKMMMDTEEWANTRCDGH